MHDEKQGGLVQLSRRQLLQGLTGLGLTAGGLAIAAGCSRLSKQAAPAVGDARLETTRLRFARGTSLCITPQFLAEPMLRAEGFTEIEYLESTPTTPPGPARVASGAVDFAILFSAPSIIRIDAGDPVTLLAPLHTGCFELFGTDHVRSIRDLKGKRVGTLKIGTVAHVFVASMAAYVGLDPNQDIEFLELPAAESMRRLEEGTIDAFLGFPPEPQELRARKVGHVVVNSALDKPWSQYFCCMIVGNTEFVQQHPVATKRALRAILKATDQCAAEPDQAAQYVVDNGYAPRLDYARQTLGEIPYGRWREYDPEDAIRFYSLRLQEIGMIKSTPERIIAQGTNWRFFNELKQELKV